MRGLTGALNLPDPEAAMVALEARFGLSAKMSEGAVTFFVDSRTAGLITALSISSSPPIFW